MKKKNTTCKTLEPVVNTNFFKQILGLEHLETKPNKTKLLFKSADSLEQEISVL